MKIKFRVRIDDPSTVQIRLFVYEQDMPYPQVPRIGEAVIPASSSLSEDQTLKPVRVADVIYAPDGTVILDFHLDGLDNDGSPQVADLETAGYREVM